MVAGAMLKRGTHAMQLPVMGRAQQGQVFDRGWAAVGVFDQMMGVTG